ncbi:MAG TPA: cystathionine gamma-lyase, partial [Cytophagales bacterium]|nr:cystathionine gamma-lyase [Cytophagales bacterium]
MQEKTDTLLQHLGEDRSQHHGAVVPPIYQNSLFTFESWEAIDEAFEARLDHFIYSRGKNPTVKVVEEKLAALAMAEKAQLFPSGMGAIAAAILSVVNAGDHVVAVRSLYGPANNLLQSYLKPKFGVEVSYVGGETVEEFEKVLQSNTRLIYLESPASATFTLQDLAAVAQLAQQRGITTLIDNTWATPIYQQPLALGIDLEVHSCSKYLGGHSDIVAGVVLGSAERIDSISTQEMEWIGAKIAPMEAWLLLRSLRTLTLRLERHQKNAGRVAQYLN